MHCIDIKVYKDSHKTLDYTNEYKEFDGFYDLIFYIHDLLNRYNLDYLYHNKELNIVEIWSEEFFETNKVKIELSNISHVFPVSEQDINILCDMNMYGEM